MTQGMLRAARDILGPNISEGITGEDWTPPELPTHGMIPKWVYEKIQERAQFSHEDYPWVTVAYLSLEILLSGITVAGTLDKERVLDVLRNIEIITYSGRWHVDKHEDKTLYGHSNLLPYPIQMQGGKRVILWPPEYATGRWLYPLRWG
jgi:branched-chain amino acid transport system substrate-binding protein